MKKHIPKNTSYCYKTLRGKDGSIEKIKSCPWWSKNSKVDLQESGYCKYLGFGDWQEKYPTLLWDMVKECGLKEDA